MKFRDVVETLERFAPLPLQEDYDNAGLQIGLTEADILTGVLVCLDITPAVIEEAAERGCNVVVSHHPLLFHGLKCVSDSTMIGRCVRLAIEKHVGLYSAHTNLDNARGGVCFAMGERIGLRDMEFLIPQTDGRNGGSGLVGSLPEPEEPAAFLARMKSVFGVERLPHSRGPQQPIRRVALCGGGGDFLIDEAARQGADAYLTGEVHYHRYFGYEDRMWIAALGHYESEHCAVELLRSIISKNLPDLKVVESEKGINPIQYL